MQDHTLFLSHRLEKCYTGAIHDVLREAGHHNFGLPAEFLEYIPHLSDQFIDPAVVRNGVYMTPSAPGAGMALNRLNS